MTRWIARLLNVGRAGLFALAVGGILVPQARPDARSALEDDRLLTIGIADSLEGTGFRHPVGSTDFMAVTTASGTLHGTSTRIEDTTVLNFTTLSGDSIRGPSQGIGAMTYSNITRADGDWSSSATQSIGKVKFITGASNRGDFSGTQHRLGSTVLTTIRTPSGTARGLSTQVGHTTWHSYSTLTSGRDRGDR